MYSTVHCKSYALKTIIILFCRHLKKQKLQNLLCPKPRLICFERHLLVLKVKQANVEKWWWIAAAGIIYEHKFFSTFRMSPHLHMLEQLITPSSSCLMLPSGIVSDLTALVLSSTMHIKLSLRDKEIKRLYKEILRLVIVLRKGISTYWSYDVRDANGQFFPKFHFDDLWFYSYRILRSK